MASTAPQAALAIRNILIATDFSACSERALLHAVAAAHHFGSTLHLVHVVQPTTARWVFPTEGYIGSAEPALDLARGDAQKLMADVLHRTRCEDVKHTTQVELGAVNETLRAMLGREKIDMLVVGTHGRTGLRRMVMGSVAEELFRHAPCPVLTVGPNSRRTDPQTVRLKHILFPTDLTMESARALPLVKAIAADFGAKLTMMNVVEVMDVEATHDRPRVLSAIQQRMREMAAGSGPMPPEVKFLIESGDVAENVIETAARENADLVAFGLKAPDTYSDRLPWMHAYKMVCELGCPVLSLRGASAKE